VTLQHLLTIRFSLVTINLRQRTIPPTQSCGRINMKKLILALALSTTAVFACTEDGKSGFLPENDLYIPADIKGMSGLSQEQFNKVIDRLETIYAPIASNMGGKLIVARKWNDGTVNASATRAGSTWNVNMYGGLARHSTITEDGFSVVLCHEIGHHLGGAPKVGGLFNRWASNEGQSDYFATLKCLRQLFLNDDNAKVIADMEVPQTLRSSCEKAHPNASDRDICIRSGMAGVSVTNLFAALRNKEPASFDTPDTHVVARTDNAHPAYQCRLDTFFQGALCEKTLTEEVSQKDEVQGTCHGSTGHESGLRPRCWFKPSK